MPATLAADELQQLNSYLSQWVDDHIEDEELANLPPFLLEVSSPGLDARLTSDKDFAAFKGFPVTVSTTEPFKKKSSWEGTLVGRDEEHVTINLVRDAAVPNTRAMPRPLRAVAHTLTRMSCLRVCVAARPAA